MDASRPVFQPSERQHASQTTSLYTNLDLSTNSIRLIQICPELSRKGYIQCEMRNATIGSDYICLSYVWGRPDEGHPVLINGEQRTVRKNLLDFLRRARKKQFGWLWVDALCIDQANIAERTHQVQQMGMIFSRATKVISWLGISWTAAEFLCKESGSLASREHATWFNQYEYRKRAWVTQEVILAREVIMMAADSELVMDDLPEYIQHTGENYVIRARVTYNRSSSSVISGQHLSNSSLSGSDFGSFKSLFGRNITGSSLFFLLHTFRHQLCEVPRDKIFSLLALCRDGPFIKADYASSNQQLARQILIALPTTFCVCAIHILGLILLPQQTSCMDDIGLSLFPNDAHVQIEVRKSLTWTYDAQPVFMDTYNTNGRRNEDYALDSEGGVNSGAWRARMRLSGTDYTSSFIIRLRKVCTEFTGVVAIRYSDTEHGFQYYIYPAHRLWETASPNAYYWPETLRMERKLGALWVVRLTLKFLFVLATSKEHKIQNMGCCERGGGGDERRRALIPFKLYDE